MPTVTLDTSVLPADDLRAALEPKGFDFAAVVVTRHEVDGTSFEASLEQLTTLPDKVPYGSGAYGAGLYGGPSQGACLETLLAVISNGSFPLPTAPRTLTEGEEHQLRDATIFCCHVHFSRQIFVTRDERSFIRDGRRETLQAAFRTRVMTVTEFKARFMGDAAT